jgi:hypothetical protein
MEIVALEFWDDMTSTKDITRIDKAKRMFTRERWKPKRIKTVLTPLEGPRCVILKPPYPKEVQSPRKIIKHTRPSVYDIDMEDADNACVPKWVRVVIVVIARQHHNITV